MRITWSDFDAGCKRVLVRDMKNPGQKIGNDVWSDLPTEAARITIHPAFAKRGGSTILPRMPKREAPLAAGMLLAR